MGGTINEQYPVGVTRETVLEQQVRDLRAELAAAKWLRETAGNYLTPEERTHNETAAQALEALAWQEKNKAGVGPGWTETGWLCEVRDQEYVADTPLGALLAAMEGEKDDKG